VRSALSSPGRVPVRTAQPVFRAGHVKFKGGDRGLDDRHAGSGARNVLFFAYQPASTAKLGQPQRFALIRKTALGYRQAPLCAAEFEIVASEFRDYADLHIVKVGLKLPDSQARAAADSMTHSSE